MPTAAGQAVRRRPCRRSGLLGARATTVLGHVPEHRAGSPDSLAEQALRRIARAVRDRGRDPRPAAGRAARATPGSRRTVARGAARWLTGMLGRVSAKSELAKAIGYSLARWQALTRYRDDGRIEIDNNAAERALRGVALGRNNYLFMGSDAGGERAAAIYSLVETAKLNGLDPQAYLREVLDAHCRASDQPHRRAAAVEHRRSKQRAESAEASGRRDLARHRPAADRCAQPRQQPGAVPAEHDHRAHAGRSAPDHRGAHEHAHGSDACASSTGATGRCAPARWSR